MHWQTHLALVFERLLSNENWFIVQHSQPVNKLHVKNGVKVKNNVLVA